MVFSFYYTVNYSLKPNDNIPFTPGATAVLSSPTAKV